MTVDEFIERYCDFEPYAYQREVITMLLMNKNFIIGVSGRGGGMYSLKLAIDRYNADRRIMAWLHRAFPVTNYAPPK